MTPVAQNILFGTRHTIWKLDNPPAGVHDVVVTLVSPERASGTAVSFTNTNASSSIGGAATSSALSGNTSVGITTTSNGSVIYDDLFYNFSQSITPNSPQVKLSEIQDTGGGQFTTGTSALNTSTAGPYNLGWTHGGPSSDWFETAIEIKPAP